MKRISDDGIEYVPIYNNYNQLSFSEKILEYATEFLIVLFILLGCWLGSELLLLMVPKTMWLFYWPLQIVRFIGKWGTIIGWPVLIIMEIYGRIQRSKENHRKK